MELEQHYSPIYVAETNTTIYRMPLAAPTGEAVVPNAEDDGYSVYLAEDLTDSQAHIPDPYPNTPEVINGRIVLRILRQ